MAEVELNRAELEEIRLPAVCMRCGQRATFWKKHLVSDNLGNDPICLIAPLCDAHKNHWRNRNLAIGFSTICAVVLVVTSLVVTADITSHAVMASIVAAFLLPMTIFALANATSIRARLSTQETISLTGVCSEFVQALGDFRQVGSAVARGCGPDEEVDTLQTQITLAHFEAEGNLPPICIRCGAPGTCWKSKSFDYLAPHAWSIRSVAESYLKNVLEGAFPAASWIFSDPSQRFLRLTAPFCAKHRSHWFWRTILVGIGLLLLLVCGGYLAYLALAGKAQFEQFVTALFLFLAWCVMAACLRATSIHELQISGSDITLTGVSCLFVRAVNQQRQCNGFSE